MWGASGTEECMIAVLLRYKVSGGMGLKITPNRSLDSRSLESLLLYSDILKFKSKIKD